eukprot:scaffold12691_cov108-Isochrysis_galbana.AAC.4
MGTRPSATRPAPSRGCPASWCRGVADWGRDARLTVAPNDEELLLGAAVLRMIELDQARRVVRARMGRRPGRLGRLPRAQSEREDVRVVVPVAAAQAAKHEDRVVVGQQRRRVPPAG